MPQKIDISAKTIVFTVIFLLVLRVLWTVRELLFALFLAFIFMSAFKPIVYYFETKRVSRYVSITGIFVVTILFVSLLFTFVIPPLLQESFIFLKNVPVLVVKTFPALSEYINLNSISTFLPDLTNNFVKVVSRFFSNIIFVVSTVVFTFYFLSEERFLRQFLSTFLSPKSLELVIRIFTRAEKRMSAWLWGEVVLALVIGVVSYVGLTLLNIRFALPLSIIAGILEVAPIIGPIIAGIPAFFVAASTSWLMGFTVVALYFLIQQLENNLVVPLIMKRAVGIHPIITLIALTVGGKLGGFLGILLSIPLALLVESIVMELYHPKQHETV